MSSAFEFAKFFTVSSPGFQEESLISCNESASIHDVFKLLIEARILSVPVLSSKNSTCNILAIVSMSDLLEYFLSNIPETDFSDPSVVQEKCVQAGKVNVMTLVSSLKSHSESVAVVSPTATLLDVITELRRCKAHRALVADEKGCFQTLVTESRVLAFLASLIDNDPIANMPVGQIGSDFLVTTNVDAKAYDAFRTMLLKHVSGMPVMDDKGVLVGNLSASDLKLCDFQESRFWGLLAGSVGNYLKALEQHAFDANIRSGVVAWLPGRASVVTCRETDSIGKIIKLLVFYRLHRVYVVNENRKPYRVVSIQDIMQAVARSWDA